MAISTTHLRLTAVRELLLREGADALLVSGPENRRYLSGFTAGDPDWGVLLITGEAAWLLTDFRYQVWAQQEAQGFEVVIYTANLGETLAGLLQKAGVKRLGFEAAYLSYRQYQRFSKAAADAGLPLEWLPVESMVEGLRETKTPDELARMRRALDLTEMVLRQVAAELVPGLTERVVAWEIEKRLREGGAEGVAFPPIVAAGPNSACPHHHPGDYPLRRGEPIIIDLGARVEGYCADLTRTFILGEADEQFRKIYSLVRRAQERAERELKAGLETLAGDALARDLIAGEGFGAAFGHSLGHGVGLAVHEAPSLSPIKERSTVLQAGSVVTVEPGIYLTGWGGVRLEDMVLLHPEGAEVLNGWKDFYEW